MISASTAVPRSAHAFPPPQHAPAPVLAANNQNLPVECHGAWRGPDARQMAHVPAPEDRFLYTRQYLDVRSLIYQIRERGVGHASLFLTLDRQNVVAEKNGFGRALFFVNAHTPPDTNVELMSLYLKALDVARRDTHLVHARDLVPDCAALAAHYLLECDWFGLNLPQSGLANDWILMANNLRRVVSSFNADFRAQAEVCKHALIRLAQAAAAETDPGALPPWACVALGRVLAYCASDAACRAQLERIAQRINVGAVALGSFGPGHCASLAHTLSKVSEMPACMSALIRVARAARLPATIRHWELTALIKGLAVAIDTPACRQLLGRTARLICRKDPGAFGLSLRDMDDIAGVFVQLPAIHDCRLALKKMALYVAAQPAQLLQMESAALVWMINAIGTPDDVADAAVTVAAQSRDWNILAGIATRSDQLNINLHALTPQARGALLNALGADPGIAGSAAVMLTCRIICLLPLQSLPMEQITTMICLAGRWADLPEPRRCRSVLARHVLVRKREALIDLSLLPRLVDGLSARPPDPACQQLLDRVAVSLSAPEIDLREVHLHALALLAAFVGKYPGHARYRPAVLKIADRLGGWPPDAALFRPHYLVAFCLAMSAWREEDACRRALARLADCTAAGMPDPATYDAHAIASLLQAFSLCPAEAECAFAARRLVSYLNGPFFDRAQLTVNHRSLIWQAMHRWAGIAVAVPAAPALADAPVTPASAAYAAIATTAGVVVAVDPPLSASLPGPVQPQTPASMEISAHGSLQIPWQVPQQVSWQVPQQDRWQAEPQAARQLPPQKRSHPGSGT